jgi:hypothetical protein
MQRAARLAMVGNPAGLVAWVALAIGYGLGVRALRRLGKPTPEEPAGRRDRRVARIPRSAWEGRRP